MKLFIKLFLLAFLFIGFYTNASAQKKKASNKKPDIEFTLNAYSFSDLLLAKDSRDKQTLYSYFNLLDWCAANNIKGIDLTGYFFPGYPAVPSDEYLAKIKQRCATLGIVITGTGIRNNFASPDPAIRAADVALAKKWIPVAAKLGAPVLRLFAGEIPKGYENKWDEVAGWMIECYKEVAVEAEKYHVTIGIQNHGDMLQTAEQCFKVVKAVDSKWAGLITDIGNFKTADPYKDIEAVIPITVNWQIKESVFGIGNPTLTDYKRFIEIAKRQEFKGYMPIETLLVRGIPYDPFKLVLEMKADLEKARDAVYK